MLTTKQKKSFLKQVFLFNDISQEGLDILSLHAKENKYKKKEIIFNEGEKGENLHVIISGKVKIIKTDKKGNEKILAILKEKDCFGEMALLTKEQRSATVIAITDVITLSIDSNDFISLIKKEPSITLNIIKTLSDRLIKTDKQLKNIAFGSAEEKVLNILYDVFEKDTIDITQQDIANLAGLSRETVSRILNKLKKQKIIDIKNKKIKLLNLEKIKEKIL